MNGHIINGYHGWTWLTSLSKVQVTDAYAMHPFEAFGTMGALDCNSHFTLANLADLDTLYFWRCPNPPQIVFMVRQGFVTNKWSGFWESMATVCSYNTMHCWFRWSKLNSLINTSNHLAPREKIHRFKGIGLGLHLAPKIPFSMCDMYYVCTEQSWLKRYARLWESTSLDLIESGGATLGVWSI